MVPEIAIASQNQGKIKEFELLFANLNINILPRIASSEIVETGQTFVENALIKARQTAKEMQIPALGDDSGLVVPALNGKPGIYSARYAGEHANSHDNIKKLLTQLLAYPDNQRKAWFYCCLVLIQHAEDPCPLIASGIWHGEILKTSQGNRGFGYDPIFWISALNKTAAELSIVEKNCISHRGKALQSLINQLVEKI